jgi:exopolyphosphatase / guanosine-5'-triphosphate,3'-diphosphate pyrophosphatase
MHDDPSRDARVVAAIDVGTNTAKMVVAAPGEAGGLHVRHEARCFIRLGEGVDAARTIQPAALERLRAALLELRDAAHAHGAERIFVGGTSASRDARNRDALIAFVRATTGLDYSIVSGDDEAALSFAGALSAFPGTTGPCAVVDIGGGSTEVVGGTPGEAGFDFRTSLDVGSVRLTERCFTAQPPPPDQVEGAARLVQEALVASGIPHDPDRLLVGAAGTTGALARLHFGFRRWEETGPGPLVLTAADVRAWRDRLGALTFEQTLALNPEVMHGRADIFLAGLVVLDEVMRHLGAPALRISPRGLRHGYALRMLEEVRGQRSEF